VHFEIAVIAVGFAGKQALELAARRFGAQSVERRFGIDDDGGFAFLLTQFDQLESFADLALDPPVAADRLVELGALAQQLLSRGGIVPQPRVFGLSVQLGKAPGCDIPVKDASSAAPTTC
jgi:hypothetical protein